MPPGPPGRHILIKNWPTDPKIRKYKLPIDRTAADMLHSVGGRFCGHNVDGIIAGITCLTLLLVWVEGPDQEEDDGTGDPAWMHDIHWENG